MENLWIDLSKHDIKSLIHDIIETNDNEDRKYPNALDNEQRLHLFSSLFPSVSPSSITIDSALPDSLVDKLSAMRDDVHIIVPSNEAAVLMKYHL